VVVVQNGIEPLECSRDRSYLHRALGVPANKRVCISVGRASPYKRIDFIIEVARQCLEDAARPDIVFVHCGDGPDLDRLRKLALDAGISDRFFFAGRRSDVRQMLCASDFAIHASRGEAFSLAILECMSAGLAVLVPDIPSVAQAIRNKHTGMVYPDGDASAAARLLCDLTCDPVASQRLGAAAAEEVRRHYSLRGMNEQFRVVTRNALHDRL